MTAPRLAPARRTAARRARRKRTGADRAASSRAGEEEIYRRIYTAVLHHQLQPGTKLKEVELAEVFGVNRNVVRKALLRLAYDRLVALRPNRCAVVASPSVEESRDLFAARRAVEAAIVAAAAHRITPAQTRKLRALAAQESEAYRRGETRRGLMMSLQFHRELAAIGGNGVLAELLDQLVARTPLVVLAYSTGGTTCSNGEHSDIVEAVANGDAETAIATMSAHLESLESQLNLSQREEPRVDLATLLGPEASN